MNEELAVRRTAIHLLRSGKAEAEVAREVKRSIAWVYKWRKRYWDADGNWQTLEDRRRTPKHTPKKLPERLRLTIREVRSELEAEAAEPGKLVYIGAYAIRGRLQRKRITPLPSISSIERELRAAGMIRPRKPEGSKQPVYPHIHPAKPRQLVQVDIVPRYLSGGPRVSCFNAIDVVSRYPTGCQRLTKQSQDAVNFLLQVWREMGVPDYTQVDNESCFSGGFSHPGVLGKVLRTALMVGTELVFSPVYHPESNGFVERFHQDYTKNVWDKIDLPDLAAVHIHSLRFFESYRQSPHHSALAGRTPKELHAHGPMRTPPASFKLPANLPLTVGKVHFIRLVGPDRQLMILNQKWDVPLAKPDQGVWATLQFTLQGAKLRVYDAAPDAQHRTCLVEHVFALKEPVSPLTQQFQHPVSKRRLPWPPSAVKQIGLTISHWISTML